MKTKYILIAIASLFVIESLNRNLNTNWYIANAVEDVLYILLGICLLMLLYKILQSVMESFQKPIKQNPEPYECYKPTKQSDKMREIEQELDEIEASLDAVTNNDKVTPIWEISTKKK